MTFSPPTRFSINLPVLMKAGQAYKIWHGTLPRIPRVSRYTLGARIDQLFVEVMEFLLLAGYSREKTNKISVLATVSTKLDALKFLLQTAWELKIIDNGEYARIAEPVIMVGLDIGKWRKMLVNDNPSDETSEGL